MKAFKRNEIMTLREMNAIRRSFRIFLSRPPGGKWVARSRGIEVAADAPWLAVVGVLMQIGDNT